ncbi:MAG: CysS/YqeB C-terminal domain-containing protein [Acidimicrobiales bacterium]
MAEQRPRLLVIMGSGETSPTMSKVHREVFARLGSGEVPAAMLDTPFGFQENADDIVAKAVDYFRESVRRPVAVASYRSSDEIGSVEHETSLARLREAGWVFAGPGSPSHALRRWRESGVPAVLAEKLRTGGSITFASAAAVTLGPYALPVYEIYKVGETPFWLDGLDLMADVGLRAVVIPHFNNAEGGNHDTRYCYMGERRLRMLEDALPDDVFVLGVDEHTACVLDLDSGRASVAGLGCVTVRVRGVVVRQVSAGESVGIRCLAEVGGQAVLPAAEVVTPTAAMSRSPLQDELARQERTFEQAVGERDAKTATQCILELDDLLVEWSRDTLQSDEMDRARAALRSMIVRLGEAADEGLRDPREVVEPLVEALLDARRDARDGRRWSDADAIRDRLVDAGIEVRDTPDGTEWQVG